MVSKQTEKDTKRSRKTVDVKISKKQDEIVKTYLESDWIEVHSSRSRYMAKVFLTDGSEAYMIVATPTGKKFFRVRSELLRLGEIGFFEKVMESAEELTLSQASEMGFVERKGQ